MKLRNGFVSNSSSSSFVIKKSDLTAEQLWAINNHLKVGQWLENAIHENSDEDEDKYWKRFYGDEYDKWEIEETEDEIKGETILDNFDMCCFLRLIGVVEPKVEFKEP